MLCVHETVSVQVVLFTVEDVSYVVINIRMGRPVCLLICDGVARVNCLHLPSARDNQ